MSYYSGCRFELYGEYVVDISIAEAQELLKKTLGELNRYRSEEERILLSEPFCKAALEYAKTRANTRKQKEAQEKYDQILQDLQNFESNRNPKFDKLLAHVPEIKYATHIKKRNGEMERCWDKENEIWASARCLNPDGESYAVRRKGFGRGECESQNLQFLFFENGDTTTIEVTSEYDVIQIFGFEDLIDGVIEEAFGQKVQKMPERSERIVHNKSSGCYIATCAYGSYDCPEVWILRRYRDCTLKKNWLGRVFIKTYYSISPGVVKLVGSSSCFKYCSKMILDRVVTRLAHQGYSSRPYLDQ